MRELDLPVGDSYAYSYLLKRVLMAQGRWKLHGMSHLEVEATFTITLLPLRCQCPSEADGRSRG
jgi:hypothetical protein